MIQVATIVPTPLLHLTKEQNYNMSLAQFIGVDDNYTRFFKNQKQAGKFVLMDNGCAEGEAPTAEELIRKIDILQPTEVILPDTLYDMDDTIRKGERAIGKFVTEFGGGFDLMAVPQGEDFITWMVCAQEMIINWPIKSLGISKFITHKYGDDARYLAVQAIKAIEDEWTPGKHLDIHLLGCWDSPVEIGQIQADFEVRGADSAIAYVYAQAGIEFDANIRRPEHEVDFMHGTCDETIMRYNMGQWRRYCSGELR